MPLLGTAPPRSCVTLNSDILLEEYTDKVFKKQASPSDFHHQHPSDFRWMYDVDGTATARQSRGERQGFKNTFC